VEPSAEHVWLEDGFEPGRTYQLVYETDRAPVAGLGLLAARDVAEFLRTPSATNPSGSGFHVLILYGKSHTGRMLRHFLSLGLSRREDGSRAWCTTEGLRSSLRAALERGYRSMTASPRQQTIARWRF
jgi:hypothetical protein